jgi:uncharacterized protein (TIGR03086 family)
MLDLTPATDLLGRIVAGVRDDQLTRPTPCTDSTVGDLLDHVNNFSQAFTHAANKTLPEGGSQPPPRADASRLPRDWRTRVPERLAALASAWQDASAWHGMTHAGGLELPAEVTGVIALNETIVHGWDIAVACSQPYTLSQPDLLQAALGFVQQTVAQHPHGSPGLFGPPVQVSEDAPLLARLIALTGRDPTWRTSET